MENENQNTQLGVGGDNGASSLGGGVHEPPPLAAADVSLDVPQTEVLYSSQAQPYRKPLPFLKFIRRLDVMLIALLLTGGLIFYFVLLRGNDANQRSSATPASNYGTIEIPLDDLVAGKDLALTGAPNVTINGSLQLADTLTLSPSLQPTGAKAGQIYYDQDTNQLAYFNGEIFVFLSGPGPAGVQSLGGATGQLTLGTGLSITGNQLNNTLAVPSGVLSVQGLSGDVTLTAGPGIVINGTNFSNSGVLSIAAGSPNVTVSDDGAGNVIIEVEEPVLGTGTVTSSGGTAGTVPVFTADQNIEDSIITQSGLTVTVSGDLSIVTGGLSLSNALTVSNGGTGTNSLAANGVLIGQGTSAITSVTAGGTGLCLLSTAGAPTWAACPSASGVNSLNGLSGALSIANASAAGSTITIDDASTTTKGVASFNGTNFTAAGGAVNTIQNIHTGAIPTFAGVNTNTITPNAALTVGVSAQTALLQGSTTTITSNGAGNNIVLNSAATIELQDNTNITGNLATTGDLAVNGGDITSTSALNITSGGALAIGSASQTLTLQGGATTSFRATSGANTTVVGFTSPTANTTLNFPALAAGTYTICTTAGNCSAAAADTLQSAYDNSTSPEIVLDATRGAVTIRDNTAPLGANLLEVQNNDGSTTFFAVTSTGVGVTGSAVISGDINTTGGTVQTNGISRIDGTGNLINIASVSAGGNATFQGGGLTLGTTSQAGSIVFSDGSGNTGTLQVAALGQNTVYVLPDPGAGTATICLSTGNCAGAGGGITGNGTANTIPLFTDAQTIGDSIISQNATTIDIAGALTLATALGVTSGGTGLNATPTNGQLLIGNGTGYSLASLTNNGGLTISNGAGSIGLAVNYGSVAGTAVQGSVSLVCPGGTGNLTGGGNTITLGAGGTCTSLSTVNNPTFTTSVTTPLLASGGVLNITPGGALTVGATGQTALLQGSTTTITSNGAGNDIVLTSADQIRLTGFNCTAFSNGGTLTTDASGNLVCAHDDGGGSAPTFQSVYDNSTPSAFTLNSTNGGVIINDSVSGIGGSLLAVQNNDGSTTYFTVASTGVSVSGSVAATGNINTSGGAVQTGGTTRIDNSGNLTNIGTFTSTGTATLQGGILVVGTDGQAGSISFYDGGTGGSAFTGTLQVGTLTQNTVFTLPDPGAGTATICLSTGNCAGAGGGITGSGTTNRLAKFTGSGTIGDSTITDDGTNVSVSGNITLQGGTLTAGADSQAGSLVLHDGGSGAGAHTTTLQAGSSAANLTFVLPTTAGVSSQCLKKGAGNQLIWDDCEGGAGGSTTFQSVYDNSSPAAFALNGTNGGLTINDSVGGIGAALLAVQNNDGSTTYFTVASTGVSVSGSVAATGNINTSGGAVQTGGTTRIDNSGNLTNIGTFTSTGTAALQGGILALGTDGQAGTVTFYDGGAGVSASTGTLQLATLGQNTVYTLPDPGAGTATICLNTGNCAGAGSGVTTPGGTTNTIPLFTGSQTIDDSIITQSGTTINIAGSLTLASALGVGQGGTGLASTPGNGQLLIGNGTGYTLGTLSNNGGLTVTNGAGSIGLAVNYGSVAGTAVQGSTTLVCPSGGGNLTGGGTTVTLGAGGTCSSLNTVNNPTFTTSVTTPLVQNAGLTLAATGANSLLLQTNGNTRLTIDSTGNMSATGNLTLQGGGATLGTTSQTGSLVMHDGNGQTTTVQAGNSTSNLTFILPTNSGVANQCLKQSGTGNQLVWQDCDGGSGGSSATLQTAYNNSLDPEIVLNDSVGGLTVRDNATPITGNLLEVQNNAGNTNYFSISTTGAAVAGTFTATGNINTSGAIQTGGTTRIDASGNLTNIGTVSAGAYNGQTISSAANFTGTLGVAGNTTLTGDLAVNGGDLTSSGTLNITPGGTLTVGVAGHQLILQGNVNTQLSAVGDGFTTAVGFNGTAVGNVRYDFDRTVAAGTYTICTTIGNCAGSGGGVTTSGGTTGTLAKFTGSQTLGDSLLSESGSTVTVNGNLNLVSGNQFQVNGTQISSANLSNDANLAKLSASQTFTGNTVAFQNGADSTNAFNVQNTLGNRVLTVDTATSGGQVVLGIGSALSGRLVFNNVTNNNTVTILPGTPTGNRTLTLPDVSGIICTNTGNCAGAGSTLQTSYNFSVGGTTPKIKVNNTLLGVDIQDADTTIAANLFNVRASNASGLGAVMLGVSSEGYVTMQNADNDAAAFRLLTQGGTSVLTGDTENGRVILGQSSTLNGRLVFNNATNANTITLIADTAGGARTITLPDATGTVCLQNATSCGFALSAGSTSYIQNQNSGAQTSSNFWISGTGRADTSLLAPAFDSASGGVTLGATNASSVTIGKTSGSTPVTINSGTGDISFNTNSASASIIAQSDADSATAFQVQNAAGQGVLTVNTASKLVTVNALAGTGSLALDVEGAIQQTGLTTPDSGASPGQWTKLGTCTIDQQYEHCATVLNIVGGYDGAIGSNSQATVSARVKQQNALGGAPLVNLTLNDTAEVITRDDLKIVVTQNDGTATVAELWGRITINFERWHYAPTINANSYDNKWAWSPNTAFQAALPAGTQTAARYGNSYANTLLVRNSSNSATAFQVQNASDIPILTVDATTSRVAIGGSFTPQQTLDVVGNVQVRDAATATKSYRLRTSGSALDFEAGGTDIIYSAWTGADFTGTQRNYLRLQSGAHIAQAIGSWQFKLSSNGTTRHTIDGTAGADVAFNQNGEATDFTIQGDTAASLFFVDGSADRIGIATNAPGARLDVLGATTGDAFNVSNSTSNGNIATFKDNNTTVATIADGGATTFQNSTDSGDAFRILNSTGGSLMDVDSTNAVASLLGLNSGSLSPWSTNTSNPLPVARYGSSTVTANGYVYVIGGNNSSHASTDTVYYAKLNGDGTVGGWNTTSTLPATRNRHSSVVANGYVYVVGGEATADVAQSTIYYAKLKHDGTLEAWNTTSSIPAVRTKAHVMVDNGYLYVIGGYNGTTDQTTVYYTRIKADGTLNSSWTTDTDTLPQARAWGTTAVMNGYVYVMGGSNSGTAMNSVYYSKLSASGGVGTWSTTSTLPSGRKEASSVVVNGHVYIMGGSDASPQATIYHSKVNLDGTLGTWNTDTADPLPATRVSAAAMTANGYVYMMGGFFGSTGTTTVYYTSSSRLQIGASLDLVGLQAQNLAEGGNSSSGSAGGALTAGNGTFVGSLQVQGESQFIGSVSVNRDFNVAGLVVLKNAVNSTEAFQVMNSTGVPLFVADTSNSRLYVGNPTADTTGALLVLDSKNDAGATTADPTGVAGGMYYNVDSNKFRCYENGAWRDCLNAVSRGKYKLANETATSNTYQNDDHLSFTYEANKKYQLAGTFYLQSPTTADIKFRWTYSGTAEGFWNVIGAEDQDIFRGRTALWTSEIAPPTTSSPVVGAYEIRGTFESTSAGTLQLQWAQNTTSGTTTFYEGSWVELKEFEN